MGDLIVLLEVVAGVFAGYAAAFWLADDLWGVTLDDLGMGGFLMLAPVTPIGLIYVGMWQGLIAHFLLHLTEEQAQGFVPWAIAGFVAAIVVLSFKPRKTALDRRKYE